jgi:16S rRNA (uracil1498-N3)-methyltransferase
MHIFYSNSIQEKIVTLSPDESAHCARVLRLNAGDVVHVIDGKGGLFEAKIEKADARACLLKIIRLLPSAPARNYNIHIAISPTKQIDRFEWFVEKAVEIGVDTITPLLCQRSERRVLKAERLHKLIISTMKQAMVSRLPVLHELTCFDDFTGSFLPSLPNCFIAHCHESDRLPLNLAIVPNKDITILIGPEGDFSSEEVMQAIKFNFLPVSLGSNRLRTETAGMVACSIANLGNP